MNRTHLSSGFDIFFFGRRAPLTNVVPADPADPRRTRKRNRRSLFDSDTRRRNERRGPRFPCSVPLKHFPLSATGRTRTGVRVSQHRETGWLAYVSRNIVLWRAQEAPASLADAHVFSEFSTRYRAERWRPGPGQRLLCGFFPAPAVFCRRACVSRTTRCAAPCGSRPLRNRCAWLSASSGHRA